MLKMAVLTFKICQVHESQKRDKNSRRKDKNRIETKPPTVTRRCFIVEDSVKGSSSGTFGTALNPPEHDKKKDNDVGFPGKVGIGIPVPRDSFNKG